MTPFIIAVYGILSIAAAIAALVEAPRRLRNGQAWAFWSFLFPPVVGLLWLLPARSAPPRPARAEDDTERDIFGEI